MTKLSITSDEVVRCLVILRAATKPIVAADIAKQLGLRGRRESQRRHVRAIVKHLRDEDGQMIVATLGGGYYLTDDESLWRDYLEGRQIDAKQILGKTHKQKKALTDSAGQGLLFNNGIICGAATMGVA